MHILGEAVVDSPWFTTIFELARVSIMTSGEAWGTLEADFLSTEFRDSVDEFFAVTTTV
jgi:hypothetical protein